MSIVATLKEIPRQPLVAALGILMALGGFVWLLSVPQEGDPNFDEHVAHPAYTTAHPRVYFDEGHWDVALYKPFANLIRNDGYSVELKKGAVTRAALAGYDVLLLANVLGFKQGVKQIPGVRHYLQGDAFSAEECTAIRDWVQEGGSLLLVSDYAPTSKSAGRLSREFGVTMRNGWAVEPKSHDPATGRWGFLLFTRENGQLLNHAITRGRDSSERLNKILTFTGQALDYPSNATPVLKLSSEAREYPYHEGSAVKESVSAANTAQGVALEFGKGRVVVLGEAAVLTSVVARASGTTFHFGMSYPDCDDRQLALNIMHWLSRALN